MANATFDTLHAAKALTQAGFAAPQAEAITDTTREAFSESVATKTDIAGLEAAVATDLAEVKAELKTDLAEVKAELKADIATLEATVAADLAEVKAELKTDIAEVKAEIAGLETRVVERFEALYKHLWLVALGIVTAVAAIVKLL